MILLWLDDVRDPFDKKIDWLVFSPIPTDELTEVVWVKSYIEFVNYIKDFGVPDGISFDHDLGGDEFDSLKEKTGKDCADFLVKYCLKYKCLLPKWNCQSANFVGKDNINGLLNNYLKKCEQI